VSGSVAEERIRTKAEAALREAWPAARIIHELVVAQGGCRIDLAAVTEDRIIAVEIKSERDVLTRLERQLRESRRIADCVIVVAADKHLAKVRPIAGWLDCCGEDDVARCLRHEIRRALEGTCNSPARLAMLWAEELRLVAGTGPKATRSYSIRHASDYLTGSEVRRRVCAALRARGFPRADPPVALPAWSMAA
jgi:hypothetical protein